MLHAKGNPLNPVRAEFTRSTTFEGLEFLILYMFCLIHIYIINHISIKSLLIVDVNGEIILKLVDVEGSYEGKTKPRSLFLGQSLVLIMTMVPSLTSK